MSTPGVGAKVLVSTVVNTYSIAPTLAVHSDSIPAQFDGTVVRVDPVDRVLYISTSLRIFKFDLSTREYIRDVSDPPYISYRVEVLSVQEPIPLDLSTPSDEEGGGDQSYAELLIDEIIRASKSFLEKFSVGQLESIRDFLTQ